MPSSFADSFPPIVQILIEENPAKIIDIGPGWGKYGLACREYLPDLKALHAIEVPQGRIPVQDCIYDWVYVGDARTFTSPQFWGRWDLALLIDVIEHMSISQGHDLLDQVLGSGCNVLVSTPKQWFTQCDEENPFESHVSHWTWRNFRRHGIVRDGSTIDSIIYLLKGT